MLISRLLLNGRYLKNGVACGVGRRRNASSCASDEFKNPSITRVGGNKAVEKFTIIIRVFRDSDGKLELAPYGQKIDNETNATLTTALKKLKSNFKLGDTLLVPDVNTKDRAYVSVALTCCGPKDVTSNDVEALNQMKENVRCCFAAGYKALKPIRASVCYKEYKIDDLNAQQAAHEGYTLASWTPTNEFPLPLPINSSKYAEGEEGDTVAEAQNWARHLSQMPTNKMTPEGVVKEAKKQLIPLGVNVESYDKKGIEDRKMQAFLAVAQGSSAPPQLLECEYKGGTASTPEVLLIAKGVTFDSGGLCLKKPENLLKHNGMTGAAAALGAMRGVAKLKLPIHVKLVVPLCENMISGQCLRVGDVVPTLKGLNVKVEDTDLEGHLMLADALTYGQTLYKPLHIFSIASLTPGITMATGSACYGCFTKNEDLWKIARDAGKDSGDRPWRFPIWDFYGKKITGDTPLFDLKNRGSGIASHCNGAAFLDKFVSGNDWLHYDITGVGKMAPDEAPMYLDPNFMTGRPTRALITAIKLLAKKKNDNDCPTMKTILGQKKKI